MSTGGPELPELEGDINGSVEFLQRFRPGGPWVLVGINPHKKTTPQVKTFDASTETELRTWLDERIGKLNLYFHVNPCRSGMQGKAKREDITEMSWLHVDIDPEQGQDIQEAANAAMEQLRNAPGGLPRPTCIIFSGGGVQGFWRLRDPYQIDGQPEHYEKAKLYNKQLEIIFGGDNCHNVDRIMRLPGTINVPNELKRKKGREPALAYVVEFDEDRVYGLDQFQPAVEVQTGTLGFAPTHKVEVSGNVAPIPPEELEVLMRKDQRGWRAVCLGVKAQEMDGPKEGDNSRSAWLMHGCCAMVRCNMTDEQMFAVLMDNEYGISESVLSAPRPEDYAKRQIARAREMVEVPELAGMNDRFAMVGNAGGKTRIIEEVEDMGLHRGRLTFQTVSDFKVRFCNQQVNIGEDAKGNPRFMPLGDWWLKHPQRRTYDYIHFLPNGELPNNVYNLWKGWGVEALPGQCELFLNHLRDNLCQGETEHYEYLVGWMATAVQKPAEAGQVAVVIRGKRGTGKGFFATHFGRLFGRHFLHVSNAGHVTGNFNAHLRDCVLLFADEAFFAGDRKHESTLKTLITEPTLPIEAKGQDIVTAPNFIHMIIASNSDWVVPAGQDERRFFALEAGEDHQQDSHYFRRIKQQLDSGGYEALLHYLMTYDLTGYEVRHVPMTKELHVQHDLTLRDHEQWWLEKLVSGELGCGGEAWPKQVWKRDLFANYTKEMQDARVFRPMHKLQLGRYLKRWGLETRQAPKPPRDRFYLVPPLQTARGVWEAQHGAYEWPEVLQGEQAPTSQEDPPTPF